MPVKIQKSSRLPGDRLLTDAEFAEHGRVSKTTAKRLRYSGEIPTVRIGRAVRVWQSDVDAYLARNTEGATAEQPQPNGGVGNPTAASVAPPTGTRSPGGAR